MPTRPNARPGVQEVEQAGQVDVFYGNESGFCRTSAIPYGWQLPDEQVTTRPRPRPRFNALGFDNATTTKSRPSGAKSSTSGSARTPTPISRPSKLPSVTSLTALADNTPSSLKRNVKKMAEYLAARFAFHCRFPISYCAASARAVQWPSCAWKACLSILTKLLTSAACGKPV